MKFSLMELLERSDKAKQLDHIEKEKDKKGILRAGNSGVRLEDGNYAGSCHRKAFLRMKGIDIPAKPDRAVMFAFGLVNEEILIRDLKSSLGESFDVTGDDFNTISWKTSSGQEVTGRPDIVIRKKDGTPVAVIEAKLASSLNTVRECRFANKPKLAHICQLAHYGWQLDVPMKLIYVQNVDFATKLWEGELKEYPKPGEPGSEQIEYTEKEFGSKAKNTKYKAMIAKKVMPGRTVYDVVIEEDGRVRYRKEGSKGRWEDTCVHIDGIVSFYESFPNIGTAGLGPRPLDLDVNGNFLQWKNCDYCGIKDFCDRYETKVETWLKKIEEANDKGEIFS